MKKPTCWLCGGSVSDDNGIYDEPWLYRHENHRVCLSQQAREIRALRKAVREYGQLWSKRGHDVLGGELADWCADTEKSLRNRPVVKRALKEAK